MPEPISYSVPGAEYIPVEAQPKSMACWATVITMLMSWRDQVCYSIETVMDKLGSDFKQVFEDNTGLAATRMEEFSSASGTTIEWPQCGTPENIASLLENYGPLAVVDDEDLSEKFCVHGRIVTGIEGDGTNEGSFLTIIDPDGGRVYKEAFSVFETKYESMAAARNWEIQMLHY